MSVSEFRKDLVSGEWVLIAPGRARRPHAPLGRSVTGEDREPRERPHASGCPFDDPQASGNGAPLLAYNHGTEITDPSGGWTTQVIPNKYPAVTKGLCGEPERTGPFLTHPAHGFHEIVITRDHDRTFAQFSDDETDEVLTVFRERYRTIMADECGDYISIFHNWGPTAGASIYHSHSQIISTPVIPPEVLGSIEGANRFFKEHGTPVHARLIDWEVDKNKRILYENESFIAFCPFVSKTPYEVRVFPKKRNPRFETSSDDDLAACAQVLNVILQAIHSKLGNPDLNFYIHTAPVTKNPALTYDFYHWHLEIVPRVSVAAGFELGTAVYINVVDPDDAAAELRSAVSS